MLKLFIALQMAALTSLASLEDRVTRQRDERGSVTIEQVLWAAWDAGLGTAGLIGSPIAGGRGNLEYLAHLSAERGTNPTEWLDESARLAKEAR